MSSFYFQKQTQRAVSDQALDGSEKPARPPMEPYRRMLPGLKIEKESGGEEEEEEEEEPALPTPRKRLMNFKIPLINRGAQRRDQKNLSVVARRRLFDEEGEELFSYAM